MTTLKFNYLHRRYSSLTWSQDRTLTSIFKGSHQEHVPPRWPRQAREGEGSTWAFKCLSPEMIHITSFFLTGFFFLIFIYFWLHWVFVAVCRLSLVVVSGGYSSLWCTGFSLRWLLLLPSTGSRSMGFSSCGSRALECRLSSCGSRALECRLSICGTRA